MDSGEELMSFTMRQQKCVSFLEFTFFCTFCFPFYVNRMSSHLKIEMHYARDPSILTKDFNIYRRFGCSLFHSDV